MTRTGLFLALGLLVVASACHRRVKSEDEKCRESEDCKRYGACHYVPELNKRTLSSCIPLRAESCAESQRCADEGVCGMTRDGLACEVTALGCKRSKACTLHGQCKLERRSHKDHPLHPVICAAGPSDVAEPTAESCRDRDGDGECYQHGACSLDPVTKTCLPMTDQDCAGSYICREYGECSVFPGGTFCAGRDL